MKTNRLALLAIPLVANLLVTGCSGFRKTDSSFYTHAESIRIVGYSIPGDDQKRATDLVPADGKIETIHSTPADWTSVLGIIGNILWISVTEVSGPIEK